MTGVIAAMPRTSFDLVDLASLQRWNQGEGNNDRRLARLRRNLPIALQEELTPRMRQILELYYYEGKNVTIIAKDLGINKSTVSRSLHRAQERLRHSLRYSL